MRRASFGGIVADCVRCAPLVAVLLALIAVATEAGAQTAPPDPHAVQPERPSVATHAGTVAPGWVEVEAGIERDRFGDASHATLIPIVTKIGLASHVQLGLLLPVIAPPDGSTAVGDLAVAVKWRIWDQAPVLGDFAVLPSVQFDSGSPETGTGTTDVGLVLISSHTFGSVAMDINVGYVRRSGDGSGAPRNATLWTASFGGPAVGPVGWVAELWGQPATSGPAGAESTVAILIGPTFTVRPWLALDVGMIRRITGPQPRALFAGFVYNIGRLIPGR